MLYDILIIGGGPAGLSAALYGHRAGVSVLVLDNEAGVMHEIRFGAGPVEPLADYDNYRTVDYH